MSVIAATTVAIARCHASGALMLEAGERILCTSGSILAGELSEARHAWFEPSAEAQILPGDIHPTPGESQALLAVNYRALPRREALNRLEVLVLKQLEQRSPRQVLEHGVVPRRSFEGLLCSLFVRGLVYIYQVGAPLPSASFEQRRPQPTPARGTAPRRLGAPILEQVVVLFSRYVGAVAPILASDAAECLGLDDPACTSQQFNAWLVRLRLHVPGCRQDEFTAQVNALLRTHRQRLGA